MSNTFRGRYPRPRSFVALRWAILLTAAMLAWAPADAGAVPAFCVDIQNVPPRTLTGCHGRANPIAPGLLPGGEPAAEAGMPPDSAATILSIPDTPSMVRVGRSALDGDRSAAGRPPQTASPSVGARPGRETRTAEASEEARLGPLTMDDNWYYLQFDQDGTYLFFGESAETAEQIPFAGDEDGFPDGIGLGRKWRF